MKRIVLLLVIGFSTRALAEDAAAPTAEAPPAPSAAEIQKVNAYYYKGKGAGPILIDSKLCLKVDTGKDSPTKSECIEPLNGTQKKNVNVSMWTSWLVPEGDKYEDVVVEFSHQGAVRTTKDLALSGSSRYRTFSQASLNKPGKWTIKVKRGDKEFASADVTVE